MKTLLSMHTIRSSSSGPFSTFLTINRCGSCGSTRFHGVLSLPRLPFAAHFKRLSSSRSRRHSERLHPFSPLAMASAPPPSAASSSSAQEAASGYVDGCVDFYQVTRAHQETAARLPSIVEIRTLLNRSIRGVLCTFSQEQEGYPSGSMVDFACDQDGSPVLAVSNLAVHTKNLLANPKCTLLVTRDPEDRTDLIITLYGDAISVPEKDREAARTAYLRKHPDAFWVDFGDFHFIRINPKAVRYVSGVATTLLGSGVFVPEEYKVAVVDPISEFSNPITLHMNKDHAEDTKAIVQHSTSVQVDFAYMLDLDSLGFNVKVGYQGNTLKLRIPFPGRQRIERM